MYARLIGETYDAKRSNFGDFQFKGSYGDFENPIINYYRKRDIDVFAIRGTKDINDFVEDLEIARESLMGFEGRLVRNKIEGMEKYILSKRRRDSDGNFNPIVLVGHSLGSIEMNKIVEGGNVGDIDTAIGYGHTSNLPIHKDVFRMYSYENDPLHIPMEEESYRVIKKRTKKGADRFERYHSIQNYY